MFIPLNKWLSLRGVRSLRSRDLIIGMQMCSAQNKNNNNNCAITSSQFEEDNFLYLKNTSPSSYLNDADGVCMSF